MTGANSPPPVPRVRRHDYLVKKWLQFRIVACYLFILVGGAAGLAYYLYGYSRRQLRLEMFRGHSTSESAWETLQGGILAANFAAAAGVTLLAVIITLLITLVVSRAARRLSENLGRSAGGGPLESWEPARGVHEFNRLQRLFTDALENHYTRVEELRMLSRLLEKKIHHAREYIEQPGLQADPTALRKLHVQCEKLKGAYHKFTLPGK